MAVDTYLYIDGIKGDSLDSEHKDWIEAWDIGFGILQPKSSTASTAGGHTTSRCEFRPVSLMKNLDMASSKLWQYACSGATIREAKIERFRANGGKPVKYLELHLHNVLVHAVDPHSTDTYMAERVLLLCSKIKWTQTNLGIEGRTLGNMSGGWDLAANKQFM